MVGLTVTVAVGGNAVATAVTSGVAVEGITASGVGSRVGSIVGVGTASVAVGCATGAAVGVAGAAAATGVGTATPGGRRFAFAYNPNASRAARNTNNTPATTGAEKRRYGDAEAAGSGSTSCGSVICGPVCASGVTPDGSLRQSDAEIAKTAGLRVHADCRSVKTRCQEA